MKLNANMYLLTEILGDIGVRGHEGELRLDSISSTVDEAAPGLFGTGVDGKLS